MVDKKLGHGRQEAWSWQTRSLVLIDKKLGMAMISVRYNIVMNMVKQFKEGKNAKETHET